MIYYSKHTIFFLVFFLFNMLVISECFSQSEESHSFNRVQVDFSGGMAYLVGSTKEAKQQLSTIGVSSSEANAYYRKLKLGEQVNLSIHYQVKEEWALGLDYSFFSTESSTSGYIDPQDGATIFYGRISETIYTHFAGVSYLTQQYILDDKWKVGSSVSLGWAFYRNESNVVVSPLLLTGNAPALKYRMSIERFLSRNISWSLNCSYFFSILGKVTINDGSEIETVDLEKEQRENLSRIGISSGFHIYF